MARDPNRQVVCDLCPLLTTKGETTLAKTSVSLEVEGETFTCVVEADYCPECTENVVTLAKVQREVELRSSLVHSPPFGWCETYEDHQWDLRIVQPSGGPRVVYSCLRELCGALAEVDVPPAPARDEVEECT